MSTVRCIKYDFGDSSKLELGLQGVAAIQLTHLVPESRVAFDGFWTATGDEESGDALMLLESDILNDSLVIIDCLCMTLAYCARNVRRNEESI